MSEVREYYCTYSFQTPAGLGRGRDTFTMIGEPYCRPRLRMQDIKEVEAGFLQTVRENTPEATALFLTWWTEIEPNTVAPPLPRDGRS